MAKNKNKITTQGYFIKRMRDNGFDIVRLYDRYSESDCRKWTCVVNPKADSIFVTCCHHDEWPWTGLFHIHDEGQLFPKGLYINTDSMEVIIKHFIEFNIDRKHLNNCNVRRK